MSTFDLERAYGGGPGFSLNSGFDLDRAYGGRPARLPAKKKGGSYLSNAWKEFEEGVTGLPAGVKAIIDDPVAVAQAFWESEMDRWGPFWSGYYGLATGDIDRYRRGKAKFDPNVKKNPLATALDLSLVGGGAAGRIAALSRLPEQASTRQAVSAGLLGRYQGDRRTIELSAGTGETVTGRVLPRSAVRAGRMQAVDKGLKLLGPHTPVVGEFARAARATQRQERDIWLKHTASPEYTEWQQQWARMNRNQRAVFYWYNRFAGDRETLTDYLEQIASRTTPEAAQTMALLTSPKFLKEFTAPSKKVRDALVLGRAVSESRTGIALRKGAISEEEAALAPFRSIRMVRGGEYLTKGVAHKQVRKLDAEINAINTRGKRKIIREGRKVGAADVNSLLAENRAVSRAAATSSTQRGRLAAVADKVDETRAESIAVNKALDSVMGGDLDTNLLANAGIAVPKITSITGKVTTALFTAEIRNEIKALKEQKKRYEPKLDDVDKELAENNKRIEQRRARQLTPGSTIAQLEQRNLVLRAKRDRLIALQKPARDKIDAKIAQAQQDIDDLAGDVLVDNRWQEIHNQILGQLYDKSEKVERALGRALTAEHRLHLQTLRGHSLVGRQVEARQALDAARENRIRLLQAQRAAFQEMLERQQLLAWSKADLKSRVGKLEGGGDIESLRAEIAAKGGHEPFYIPDVAASAERRKFAQPEGSIQPQPWYADVRSSKGILFRSGMLANYPDVLGPSFLRMAKHDYYTALHDTAKRLATPLEEGATLPDGWEWLKTKYGGSVPILDQLRSEHLKATSDVYTDLPDDVEFSSKVRELDPNLIEVDGQGRRLAIPTRFADQFSTEFSKGSHTVKKILEAPLTVWRALILHLRIPWLINNILGNTMLATLRWMGPNGLRAALALVAQTKGAQGVAKALGMRGLAERMAELGLNGTDMARVLPGQVRGTFYGTELPPSLTARLPENTAPAVRGTARAAGEVLGFLPKWDRRVESALRRLGSNATLYASPEVRAIYKAMPKQERSWRKAMLQGIDTDPRTQKFVMREVNDALGDFLSLSKRERNLIRQLIPFYAWFREITRITAHTAVDTPGRAAVLLAIGKIGSEQTPQNVPSYLKGIIPTGTTASGLQEGLMFRAATPWVSALQVAKAASYFAPGGADRETAREAFGEFNPFYSQLGKGIINTMEGRPGSVYGGLADPFVSVAANLPQWQAISPRPSKLFPDRTATDVFLQRLLGDPRRAYRTGVANRYSREGL